MIKRLRTKRMKSGISFCDILRAKHRKGISPVIATVLLISIVVIIGIIIFLWFRGMMMETTLKFGKNIELACENVDFDASYSAETLYIVNNGNVPIYKMKIKLSGGGAYSTKNLENEVTGWPTSGLKQGDTFTGENFDDEGKEKLTLIPVLLGTTDNGDKKEFVCDEKQFGFEISL